MWLMWGCALGLPLTLLFCLQDMGAKLSFNSPRLQLCTPSFQGLLGSKSPFSTPWV